MNKLIFSIILAVMFSITASAHARNTIHIVGSSTVFPFSTAVAETFGKTSRFESPVVESTGSGGGLKLFCEGVGVNTPDITNASRRIKKSEIELCRKNGVTDITEVLVGYDGIVISNSKQGEQININLKHLFLALAAQVPVDGELVDNPYSRWSEIDPNLPDIEITVLGPPPTSGTRDAFVEIAMEGGAKKIPMLAELRKTDKAAFKKIAHRLRTDGAFIEAGENDNLIVQKLIADSNAFGIFGFSFLDNNTDTIQGSLIDGVEPTFDAIADGSYPVSRSLFFYVKNQHIGVIPGMKEYINEFLSDRASGDYGYLSDKGLIPVPANRDRQSKVE